MQVRSNDKSSARSANGARTFIAAVVFCLLGLMCAPQTARALYLTTTNIDGSGSPAWTANKDWQTNTAPVGQGTYRTVTGAKVDLSVIATSSDPVYCHITGNGTPITNGTANTTVPLIRTPDANVAFPGVSLAVETNTVLMFKAGNGKTLTFTNLILKGGILNKAVGGTSASVVTIAGAVQVQSQSYLTGGTDKNRIATSTTAAEAFNISAALSGSGNLYVMSLLTNTPNTISGGSANLDYHGTFIVQCGSLMGSNTFSLGTNTSVIVDPLDMQYTNDMPGVTASTGNALFRVNYGYNTSGKLTINNGGVMYLNQHCAFSSVTINGQALTPGEHSYTELANTFYDNIQGGSDETGSITVQPYNPNWIHGSASILKQPDSLSVYPNSMVQFSVIGKNATGYQWLTNGVPVPGATNSTLSYGPGSASSLVGVSFRVVVSNNNNSVTSSAATVSIRTPAETYESAVAALAPYAFYQLNENADPALTPGGATAFDVANAFNGSYASNAWNGAGGIAGPTSADGFPGFSSGNTALSSGAVTVPPLNLNTNSVTFMAWINPDVFQNANAAVFFCRNSSSRAMGGLLFTGSYLGYNWNDDPTTYNWTSGLIVPLNQWSLVAVTVTPTNATVYVLNANGLASAVHTYPHPVVAFNANSAIGADPVIANRVFMGRIDDVAVFNQALTADQLYNLYYTASGTSHFGPIVAMHPANQMVTAGQTATFAVTGGGSSPTTYQWQVDTGSGVFVNINDGGQYSGARSSVLTVANTTIANYGYNYQVILSNPWGTATSTPAQLMVIAPYGSALSITMTNQQPTGAHWDSATYWNDGVGNLSATDSSQQYPGSTYEVLPGARVRSPSSNPNITFPGAKLTLDGDGVFNNNSLATNGTTSELRLKFFMNLATFIDTLTFPKLVLNGGQIDIAPDSTPNPGRFTLGGEIDVLTNAPIYNDGTSGDGLGVYVTAYMTGKGSIEYHGNSQNSIPFNSLTNNLNIACPTNTFTGSWNVVSGILLGSAPNCLGTNSITVGTNAALETTYDISNPNASLFLYGKVFLHQNDTFKSVYVNGIPLKSGTYSMAELNASYPGNFPASWALQYGSTVNTGSGSITVLTSPLPSFTDQPQSVSVYPGQPVTLDATVLGLPPLTYQWFVGTTALTDNANRTGSASNVLQLASAAYADAGNYTLVASNTFGASTSMVAVVTVMTPGPAMNFTLDFGGTPIVQPGGDWNTANSWNPGGQAASVTHFSNPGSTYEVVVGSRLRTPAAADYNLFPGDQLTIDGSGVFENNTLGSVGEMRFKGTAGTSVTNYFKKLVLAGGQLDNGSDITVVLEGELSVQANSIIYVDGGTDRGYRVDSWLTGSGDLFWHEASGSLGGVNLQITGTSNTFSGQWFVDQGVLVAVGPNSLGTNNINVGINGLPAALEAMYDINSPASLNLGWSGQVFLHQTCRFASVTIAGTPLADGTYSFAALNSTYPSCFPASWARQDGSSVTTGSGQLIVGAFRPAPPSPRVTQFSMTGTTLSISATNGLAGGSWSLLHSPDVTRPLNQWETVKTGTFDGSGKVSSDIETSGSSKGFYILKVQ